MNTEHLRAFLWLRWRLAANQWRRGGTLNAVLMMILAVGLAGMAIPLFVGCFAVGLYAFPKASPAHLLYAWDGMVAAFTLFWLVGLITELQRSESLSLTNFLHLPVSVRGVFVINYVSSLLRLSVIVFVPVLFGFALALPIARGAMSLIVLPATVAFLLMVTALSYQFQGWLASLMTNPRRRRTVIVVTTTVFVLIFQLPNLARFVIPHSTPQASESTRYLDEMKELERAFNAHEFDHTEYSRRQQEASDRYGRAG